jgi:hypothetical protein
MPQAARSTVVLLGLCVLLAVLGVWGYNAATEPFPGKSDPPKCVDTPVQAGDKVFPAQVTVSVYNASDRNGLAGLTMDLLVDEGFGRGDTGNAPRDAEVDHATIWTEDPDSPAVALVASKLGRVEIEERAGRGVGVTVLVGDSFEELSKGQRRVVAEQDTEICSPPVS